VYNLREKKVIRDLNPEDIERLVSVSGMVTRCSNIIPEVRCAQAANMHSTSGQHLYVNLRMFFSDIN